MIVDVHAHVIVPEVTREHGDEPWRPAVRWEDGAQVVELGGVEIRSAVREFVRIDRILEEESSSGVDHVVLSPWVNLLPYRLDLDEALEVCRVQNASLAAAAAANPEHVSTFVAVPLQDPEVAAPRAREGDGSRGVVGVEVAASILGAYLGDDRFLPFWSAAEAAGASVFVHPTTKGFDLPVFGEYHLWNTVATRSKWRSPARTW